MQVAGIPGTATIATRLTFRCRRCYERRVQTSRSSVISAYNHAAAPPLSSSHSNLWLNTCHAGLSASGSDSCKLKAAGTHSLSHGVVPQQCHLRQSGRHRIVAHAAAAPVLAPPVAGAAAAVAAPGGDLLAVALGYAVLVGSFFRSVPQIIKIVKNNSAEGLSLTSNVMELLCYTVSVAYNVYQAYPFSSYGEIFTVWIQDMVLVALIMWHMKFSATVNIASAIGFAAISFWMCGGGCSLELLTAMQLATIGVMAFGARLPQIWMNYKRGNAGMLSLTTCALNVIGNVIRIYTTAVQTNDAILLGGIYTQTVLNGILLWQCIASPAPSSDGGTGDSAPALAPKTA